MISRMALLHGEGHSLDAGGWGMAEQLPSLLVFRAVCIGKAPQSQRNEKSPWILTLTLKGSSVSSLYSSFITPCMMDGWTLTETP